MPFLTLEGVKTYYASREPRPQQRPPVVFIHGAGGNHQNWLYQLRDLPGSPTYAPDLPGHARSEGQGRDSITAYGDWIVSFLDALGLEQAVLVGNSMGGGIALDIALRYPTRVAGLGLIGTGARLRVAPPVFEAIQQDAQAAVALICALAFGPETAPEMVRLAQRQMGEIPAEVLLGDFLACDRFDVMDRLGEITAPTCVLCGTQDRMTPTKYAVFLRDHIAGATLHLVEGAGHMLALENPASVVRALGTLLEKL